MTRHNRVHRFWTAARQCNSRLATDSAILELASDWMANPEPDPDRATFCSGCYARVYAALKSGAGPMSMILDTRTYSK